MTTTLKRAADAIRNANRIVLAGHVNPDGDTLGSSLAITHALRAMGKTAIPLSSDGVPEIYRWMPGHEWIETSTELRDFDLAIVCDTGDVERVGKARQAIESAPLSIVIDHHAAEGKFGDIRVVNARVSATGELTYRLLRELGTKFNACIADCLMCAIITDTGSFRFMNVTHNTFKIAAALMRCGACPASIGELVFDCRSLASVKLLGRALDSLEISNEGRLTWARITARDFEELGATDEETEGIVNHVRAVRTAQVGILFREIPGKKVRISLRARNGFDVNRVTNVFGGGGHKLAAGCSLEGPLDTAINTILAEVRKWLK